MQINRAFRLEAIVPKGPNTTSYVTDDSPEICMMSDHWLVKQSNEILYHRRYDSPPHRIEDKSSYNKKCITAFGLRHNSVCFVLL